jgi:hypothetical protein
VGRALRQAALILTDGWSKNADARDDADRIVPLCGPHRSAMRTASFRCVAGAVRHRVATSAGVLATLCQIRSAEGPLNIGRLCDRVLGQEGSMKRVAIYLRVSTDKQTTNNRELEAQLMFRRPPR